MSFDVWSVLPAVAPTALLSAAFLPERIANARPRAMYLGALGGALAACLTAAVAAVVLVAHGPINAVFGRWSFGPEITFGVYFDSLAAVMLLLISLIGAVIVQFSWRYLDGEARQGRFFQWVAATLGAVMWLVLARNLVVLTAAWMLTSYGLHHLLTHYAERPAAMLAARTKFLISRIGDGFLIAGLALTYYVFGTFEYDALFAAAAALPGEGVTPLVSLIGTLFVLGAMTKSAQFPFHTWLPDSLETPTPVSALMHAGIINAGGFLVLRLSPLVGLSHVALDLLAAVGAVTALYGAVVMLTQTSIKRALAYSTVAQMGFMMLQCGVGAFSAALLHIVAHALYKAYAFLNSGSVLSEPAAEQKLHTSPVAALATLFPAALLAAGLLYGGSRLLHPQLFDAPGHWVLGLVLTLALTQWLWDAMQAFRVHRALHAVGLAAVLTAGYLTALTAVDTLMAASVAVHPVTASGFDLWLLCLAGLGFAGLFALHAGLRSGLTTPQLRALYVHAGQGFYVDLPTRRAVRKLWRDRQSPSAD